VAVARLASERAQGAGVQTGLFAALGADHIFRSVEEAIDVLVVLNALRTAAPREPLTDFDR